MPDTKNARRRMLFATKCLCVLLLFCMLLSLFGCRQGSDAPLSPGLSMIEGSPVYDDDVAMQTNHFTVTPGMMAFFFYDYGGALIVEMEKEVPYDSTKTLHDQIWAEGLSWYDVLMNSTLQKVSEMLIYCEAAHEAGVTLTEAQRQAIESEISALRVEAASYGLELDVYLQRFYGPLISAADLQQVYEYEALAATYSTTVTAELETGITEDAVKDYVKENGLTDQTPSRNIAYLVIPYVGNEPNEDAAGTALNALQNAPKLDTLEGFSDIGTVGSEKNLTPDNTGVDAIAEWLFEEGRSVDDCGRVEAGGATYILLYTGNGMTFSEVSARMRLYDIAYAAWYNSWVEALDFGYNYDILDSYDVG